MTVIEAMIDLADKEAAVAESRMRLAKVLEKANEYQQPKGDPAPGPVNVDVSVDEPKKEPESEKAVEEAPAVSIDDVRAVLAELSQNGHTADVKTLLDKHGAIKLSAVDPKEYAALIEEAKAIK